MPLGAVAHLACNDFVQMYMFARLGQHWFFPPVCISYFMLEVFDLVQQKYVADCDVRRDPNYVWYPYFRTLTWPQGPPSTGRATLSCRILWHVPLATKAVDLPTCLCGICMMIGAIQWIARMYIKGVHFVMRWISGKALMLLESAVCKS